MVKILVEEVVDIGCPVILVHHVGRKESVSLEVGSLVVRLIYTVLPRACK